MLGYLLTDAEVTKHNEGGPYAKPAILANPG